MKYIDGENDYKHFKFDLQFCHCVILLFLIYKGSFLRQKSRKLRRPKNKFLEYNLIKKSEKINKCLQ